MPKGTKDHRDKKNSSSHEAWRNRNAALSANDKNHKWFQKEWRIGCLRQRLAAGEITGKNVREIAFTLGSASSDPLRMATVTE